jgi:branched-subunit amino acid transport protein
MNLERFFYYLLFMAGVTYLVRMIPFILIRKQLQNRFLRSFLFYIPYTVLAAMTIPAIFYATTSKVAAAAGLLTAILFSVLGRSLIFVATAACFAVFIMNMILG